MLLQGDVQRGLSLFESAIAFEPTLGLARAHRAAALAKMERLEEARQELLRAVEIDPSDKEVLGYARELAVHLKPLGRQLTRALGARKSRTRLPKTSQTKSWTKVRMQTTASDVDYWEDQGDDATTG